MRNHEHKKEYDKAYHAANKGRWTKTPEYVRAKTAKYRAAHPEKASEYYLKTKEIQAEKRIIVRTAEWRQSQAQLRLLKLEAIAGRSRPETCEVCGSAGRIVFDHNHDTGLFRGWICDGCNICLGRATIPVLEKLIEYLKNDVIAHSLDSPIKVNELILSKYRVRKNKIIKTP
jgi:recombination endonuclease VII